MKVVLVGFVAYLYIPFIVDAFAYGAPLVGVALIGAAYYTAGALAAFRNRRLAQ